MGEDRVLAMATALHTYALITSASFAGDGGGTAWSCWQLHWRCGHIGSGWGARRQRHAEMGLWWGGAAVRVARACAYVMPSLALHSSDLEKLFLALIGATR